MMKWSRKTKEFEYADYTSENGLYKIRDMSINDNNRYVEHVKNGGKKTEYWALLDSNENVLYWSTTVKKLKEYAETL